MSSTILIVDDVQSIRIQVKEILSGCGYLRVKTAANGVEALKILHTEPIHCVISDRYMHPIDGIELLKEVRAREEWKNISFIMLTAESAREKVLEAIQKGVDDYIMKPLTPEKAKAKVEKAILKRKHL